MSRFNTGNPIDSNDPRDLSDNAKNLDQAVNSESSQWTDRLGNQRKTFRAAENAAEAAEQAADEAVQTLIPQQVQRVEDRADEAVDTEIPAEVQRATDAADGVEQIEQDAQDALDAAEIDWESRFVAAQDDKQDRFNAFIASSGYEFVGDYAPGIELTEYNQVVRDTNGEFWRVSGSTELPYTTTVAGLPEGGAFVPVGDAALRQELDGSVQDGQGARLVRGAVIYVDTIADLQALDTSGLVEGQAASVQGSEFRWDGSEWRPVGAVSIRAFGALGDGDGDDTQSISDAIVSGYPLDWGGLTYRITDRVSVSVIAPVSWFSQSAVVNCESSSNIQEMFRINTEGYPINIIGKLTLDGKDNARRGIFVRNGTNVRKDVFISDLEVKNIFRSDDSVPGGDGIDIRGAFGSVYLERPVVRKVTMAEGAVVPLLHGVSGITVIGLSGKGPLSCTILDPFVDGVYSLDVDEKREQDGIRIFADSSIDSANLPSMSRFSVIGGVIRNASNRAIKSQAHNTLVQGIYIERDGNEVPSIVGDRGNPEITFQDGGGTVRDVTAKYIQSYPSSLIRFGGVGSSSQRHFGHLVDNVSLYWEGSSSPINFAVMQTQESVNVMAKIKNINMTTAGSQLQGSFFDINASSGDNIFVSVSECFLLGLKDGEPLVTVNDVEVTVDGQNMRKGGGSGSTLLGDENCITTSSGFMSRILEEIS